MNAFFKTLFGDAATIAAVAIVMAGELLLVGSGQAASAGYAIPIIVLVGTAWLAMR